MENILIFVFILLGMVMFASFKDEPLDDPNLRKTTGKVLHKRVNDNTVSIVVEFFVDGRPYRSAVGHYPHPVDLGDIVEVYYDVRDPRETILDRVVIDEGEYVICNYCHASIGLDESVCPYCGTLVDKRNIKKGECPKPIKRNSDLGLTAVVGMVVILYYFMIVIGFFYAGLSGVVDLGYVFIIITVITGVPIYICYWFNKKKRNGKAEGVVIYTGEEKSNRGKIMYKASVEFTVNDTKYTAVGDNSKLNLSLGDKVEVNYKKKDPRDATLGKRL